MLRDRIEGLLSQEDDEGEDIYFSDVTKVEISLSKGFGIASTRTVIVTNGHGPSANTVTLFDVNSIHFDSRKYDWIFVGDKGTDVSMEGSKGVPGHFFVNERQLRIGREEIGD